MSKRKIIFSAVGVLMLVLIGLFLRSDFLSEDRDQAESFVFYKDGKYLGYIHQVKKDSSSIYFDDAVWLSGRAGEDAAIEAGHCTEATREECLPNDFFIKNEKITDEVLLIDGGVRVFMQTWKMEETGEVAEREIDLNNFSELINNQTLHWRNLPFNITIQDGKIIKIEEVYIP